MLEIEVLLLLRGASSRRGRRERGVARKSRPVVVARFFMVVPLLFFSLAHTNSIAHPHYQ
jgi:hypothetical protein